ncbi:D-alanyl-D-alanine carboxypeptidase [Bartonella sp. DGB2]|uniref:D-alanyl-D-alanine carboxypeptidase n=1 Tax=Bartonella sp. DGB2 TaxID=3388426 RepID=UPI0039902325
MYQAWQKITQWTRKASFLFLSISLYGTIPAQAVLKKAPSMAYTEKYAAIIIDANNGKTLFQANASAKRYPASLTKMMTLYLLFESIQSGRVSPNTPIPVSSNAAAHPPTKIGFKPNETIGAKNAALALIVKSANDVAVAIAEYLGGSETNFARLMNKKARQLGMLNTHFANASGLPDPQNYSTARDMAILSLALRNHFPRYYKLFSASQFQFRGQTINGHNKLVKTMAGVDGIKTGYTNMSGSNLASSIRIDRKSLVAVVMGARSAALRDAHMADLLSHYLPQASERKVHQPPLLLANNRPNLPIGSKAPIPMGKRPYLSPREQDSIILTALASQSLPNNEAVTAANQAVINDHIPVPIKNPKKRAIILPAKAQATKIQGNQWAIQIGASTSQAVATRLLTNAKKAASKTLSKVTPLTQRYSINKTNYYRARFAGFNSKQAANSACTTLKKANFNCYALSYP